MINTNKQIIIQLKKTKFKNSNQKQKKIYLLKFLNSINQEKRIKHF